MNVKNMLSHEEIQLFRDAVGKVTPVRSDKVAQRPTPPAPRAYQTRLDQTRVMEEILHWNFERHDFQPGDELCFCRPGVRKTVMRKLRRGQYRVTAELDLHGTSASAARRALAAFVQQAKAANARCVRIVHGKGRRSGSQGPLIKPLVGGWLLRNQDVLAFCSARPADGGTGAVYVLLRAP